MYVGIVPGIPGAHTQSATLDELRENLKDCYLSIEESILPGETGEVFLIPGSI